MILIISEQKTGNKIGLKSVLNYGTINLYFLLRLHTKFSITALSAEKPVFMNS